MSPIWNNWLKQRTRKRRTIDRRRGRKPVRLCAEALESRTVPAVYDVTTTADVVNANDGVLSLREAVLAANASVGVADVINVPAGTYVLTLTGAGEDGSATGDLDVSGDVTIQGAGASSTTLDGDLSDRVFDVQSGVVSSIVNMTIHNGRALGTTASPDGQGGGVRSFGRLTLTGCVVTSNSVVGADATGSEVAGRAFGGGVYQSGSTLTLTDSLVANNRAQGGGVSAATSTAVTAGEAGGGGVCVANGPALLRMSGTTIADNQATGGTAVNTVGAATGGAATGGGVQIVVFFSHQIVGNTFARNRAIGGSGTGETAGTGGEAVGGGIALPGDASVNNCTISGNQAVGGAATTTGTPVDGPGGDARGGGLAAYGGVISNTTITLNIAAGGTGNRTPGSGTGGGAANRGTGLSNNAAFQSSILAGNSATTSSPDIVRPATDSATTLGNNLIGDGTGAPAFVNGRFGDQVGGINRPVLDARLGPLANNGGATQTHAPLNGSPAINAGSNPVGLTTDQRGAGYPRVLDNAPDVGAVETPFSPPTAVSGALPDVTVGGGTSYSFTVTYADDVAMDVTTFGSGAIVSSPNGFSTAATFLGVDVNSNGTPRTATYRFTPPGGSWDGPDYGTYFVSPGLQAANVGGSYAIAAPIGSFQVRLPSTLVVTNANNSGPGSLREAIDIANFRSGEADTIVFDATTFNVPRTITPGELTITDPVSIEGPGATLLTISGNNVGRVFRLDGTGLMPVTIAGLTLTGGRATGNRFVSDGGGVINNRDEQLTLRDCVVTGNTSATAGGAILNWADGGSLTLIRTTVSNNTASTYGGGIGFAGFGALTVLDSAIVANRATGVGGGGIGIDRSATMLIRNSTFAGNTTPGAGGGLLMRNFNNGSLVIENSTFTGNIAGNVNGGGGGVFVTGGSPITPTVTSTVIAGNTGPLSPDIFISQPFVLTHSAVGVAGDLRLAAGSGNNLPYGVDLKLGPLGAYGGSTPTCPPLPGSPLIDAGSNQANLTTDQRGAPFARVVGAAADIGAFEVPPPGTPATVSSVVVNAGAQQRSIVTRVTVAFSAPVNFVGQPAAAFRLSRTGPGQPSGDVMLTVDLSGSTPAQTVATITFSGPLTEGLGNSLMDGTYTLTVLSGQVNGGIFGGDNVTSLHRLYGDVNGDRAVNGLDLAAFRTAFGTSAGNPNYVASLDQNGDGAINGLDLAEFRVRFGTQLP